MKSLAQTRAPSHPNSSTSSRARRHQAVSLALRILELCGHYALTSISVLFGPPRSYISPDIYVFEPSRQSAEKASAVLTINRKTGDVATKLNTDILRTVRERTMENCE
ncbi:unnamed protein product [Tilletia controversa]|nr:unnamed protein product [Tilletia controversa]